MNIRFVITLIISFYACSLIAQTNQLTLSNIYAEHAFVPQNTADMHFSASGTHFFKKEGSVLNKVSLSDFTQSVSIVNVSKLVTEDGLPLSLSNIKFDHREEQILFLHQKQRIYRHSFKSVVYLYNLNNQSLEKLRDEKIMYPSFSPDDKQIAYVFNRDIWVYDIATKKHKQITLNGKDNAKMNGMSDWVYEEEFVLTKAYEWMPDNKHIVYLSMDETQVKEYEFQYQSENPYPQVYKYKYPKTGQDNSIVKLHMVNTINHSNKSLAVMDNDNDSTVSSFDIYIPRIYVTSDGNICAMRMNRLQNKMQLLYYKDKSVEPIIIYEEIDKYYVDLSNFYIKFLEKGNFLITSEREGFNQLYLYKINKGLVRKLTKSQYDIDQVVGYNPRQKTIFYTLPYPSRVDRNLYTVNLKGTALPITSDRGWNEFSFAPNANFYLKTFSTLSSPPKTTLVNYLSKQERVLVNNDALKSTIDKYKLVNPELMLIPNRHGEDLEVHMYRPTGIDLSGNVRLPVLFYNYGGPGSQKFINRYDSHAYFWIQMLVQRGYVVVTCDNTGTGFKGAEFKKKTYLKLGQLEIEDQIDIAKNLAKLPYINENRIGHIGWSFGGFMSALAITKGADNFKSAVAIAPVSHWKYYDNIYTERFMRKPIDNPQGYRQTSPITYVDRMKGKFLIIHGSADDNVHIQNTYALIEEMVQQNKKFDMCIYPDKNHGIYGGNTTFHLWRAVTDWLYTNL